MTLMYELVPRFVNWCEDPRTEFTISEHAISIAGPNSSRPPLPRQRSGRHPFVPPVGYHASVLLAPPGSVPTAAEKKERTPSSDALSAFDQVKPPARPAPSPRPFPSIAHPNRPKPDAPTLHV